MAQPNELIAGALPPSLDAGSSGLFSELQEFCRFLWEELKPFPGRGHAVVRMVVGVVAALIVCETLRIPQPNYAAYLIFFVVNEDGVNSVKLGLLAMVGLTLALGVSLLVTTLFMDAPWFRLPATFLLIVGSVWLSRTLVLAPIARMIAVVFVLYLSLADTIFEPEALTESTLWLWSIVGVAVGISILTSLLLEPRPDLLLRQAIEANLGSVQHLLESMASGRRHLASAAKDLRRQVYGAPQRLRQLLSRWRQRRWPALSTNVDWDLGIFIVERLLTASAALAVLNLSAIDERTRQTLAQLSQTVGQLKQNVHDRNSAAIHTLALPSTDNLPDSLAKAGIIELVAILSDCRSILIPYADSAPATAPEKTPSPKPWALVPDALTNPEYIRFAIKTTLAVLACEIFLNAVDWPGIRTSMITCVVTALGTVGAQRQKQLLRLTGAFVGGLMGLASVIFLVPQMDTIVSLSLLVAAGTACCAWVAAGSVRTSYAGFQMALCFFIMLIPGFDTNIDLTGVRDRFVGILVGITATWIFFDHLWHTSSRRQLVDKLVAILRLMAKAPTIVTPALSPDEARAQAATFRRNLSSALDTGRLYLDETKIELTLALKPSTVRGNQLEVMASEVSFAAFLLLALNAKKLRTLASGNLASIQPLLQPADASLAAGFTTLANAFEKYPIAALETQNVSEIRSSLSLAESPLASLPESNLIESDLRSVYQTLGDTQVRIATLDWMVQALPGG